MDMNNNNKWMDWLYEGIARGAYGAVEDESGQDEIGALPVVSDEHGAGDGGEDEGSEAGAADGDARGQRPPLLEVVADRDDGRQVDESEADAAADAVRDQQHRHRVRVGAGDERQAAEDAAHDARRPAPESVR